MLSYENLVSHEPFGVPVDIQYELKIGDPQSFPMGDPRVTGFVDTICQKMLELKKYNTSDNMYILILNDIKISLLEININKIELPIVSILR